MQAVTVASSQNDGFPVPYITVASKPIGTTKRWGIRLPRGARKPEVFILIGEREHHLVRSADDPRRAHVERVGLMARKTQEQMHFLIIDPKSDKNPDGTALLMLTVDSGIEGGSFIEHHPGCPILSLHTYAVPSLSGPISRSGMLAIFKPGEVIRMKRTGNGITLPYGIVQNVNGRIESTWTRKP